jgi:hypothetical protein
MQYHDNRVTANGAWRKLPQPGWGSAFLWGSAALLPPASANISRRTRQQEHLDYHQSCHAPKLRSTPKRNPWRTRATSRFSALDYRTLAAPAPNSTPLDFKACKTRAPHPPPPVRQLYPDGSRRATKIAEIAAYAPHLWFVHGFNQSKQTSADHY